MKRLLDPLHRHMLSQWVQDNTLFAFDFDGTLAPIVDDPEQAFMPAETWRALAALSALARVAVISGRAQTDLQRRLPSEVTYVIGNHGNEGPPAEDPALRAEQIRCCQDWVRQLQAQMADNIHWHRLAGVSIENKGLTLSIHYRHCPDHAQARETLSQFIPNLEPQPQVIGGLDVINLLPPHAQTKREAMVALMLHSGCQRGLYVGDDTTDEHAFASAPTHWLTVRVGETAPSQARYRVASPDDVRALIELAVKLRQPDTVCTEDSVA